MSVVFYSDKRASLDVDGDRSAPAVEVHKVPLSELELHADNELPSDSGATVAYSLPMDAEPTIRNEVLASIDVDVDKSALVDVGDYDYIQATGEILVQDCQPTKKLLTYQTKKL